MIVIPYVASVHSLVLQFRKKKHYPISPISPDPNWIPSESALNCEFELDTYIRHRRWVVAIDRLTELRLFCQVGNKQLTIKSPNSESGGRTKQTLWSRGSSILTPTLVLNPDSPLHTQVHTTFAELPSSETFASASHFPVKSGWRALHGLVLHTFYFTIREPVKTDTSYADKPVGY